MDKSTDTVNQIANIIVSSFTDKLTAEKLDYEHDVLRPMLDNPPEYNELQDAILQIAQIIINAKKTAV